MGNYFPDEIIFEILMRLAVKSLVRFICVNKAWCSIISNPNFASAHVAHTNRSHNNNTDQPTLLLAVSCEALEYANHRRKFTTTVITPCLGKRVIDGQDQSTKSFDLHEQLKFSYKSLKHFELVGSCNGLVLIKRYIDTLLLWNPLLGKSVPLPKPDNIGYEEHQMRSTGWGFGFDSQTYDYKVVKIVLLENNGGEKLDSVVQVFSLATGDWKSFRVGAPACSLSYRGLAPTIGCAPIQRLIHRRPQPFINGAIHWLASARSSKPASYGYRHLVLSFDISNEIFREIMLPEKVAYLFPPLLSISVYGKSLAVCCSSSDSFQHSLWVMKEYGEVESWTQVLIGPNIPKPLGFTTGGEVVWKTGSGIALYDPKKPKIMNHSVEGRYCFAGSYMESLVLLDPTKRESKKGNRRATKQKIVIDYLETTIKRVIKKRKGRI
ncbi:F-box/kelch-repeat protein At3g06240-like [Corylus avellana]|uniref:F-box/kelch-repeat protein At3g06240-like n=1 Tax=Corylus avellana TaxID=13451 RepID=UPI00286C7F4B|nr:F-box/kelch-repeat protein At3g06240-like [Corylus avellana]